MARKVVNNQFYDELGEGWYSAEDHPIALLRAENQARIPWVLKRIEDQFPKSSCDILDIGCGAGFLTNRLAKMGHRVSGLDLSLPSLAIARAKDTTRTVNYLHCDAYHPPFMASSFDVITAMDFLEHIEEPFRIIKEVNRLLRPGGLFFFHTFNRTPLSWLFAVKGVKWFVKNSPANLHLYRLFIKPQELKKYLAKERLQTLEIQGLVPTFNKAFCKMLLTRRVEKDFTFHITNSLSCGYIGFAKKTLD